MLAVEATVFYPWHYRLSFFGSPEVELCVDQGLPVTTQLAGLRVTVRGGKGGTVL